MADLADGVARSMTLTPENAAPPCSAYIQAKGRPCRFPAAPGSEYCYSHRTQIGSLRRVPCPLDPRHFVHEAQLKRHLAKCPARLHEEQTANLPFFRRSCNAPTSEGEHHTPVQVNQLTGEELVYWEELIDAALESALLRLFPESVCDRDSARNSTDLLHQCFDRDSFSDVPDWLQRVKHRIEADGTPADGKHSLQLEQLLFRCVNVGFFADPARTCFLEYGSGKGRLSRWFALAAEEQGCGSPSFVLVERGAHRIKAENRMDARGAADRVLRLRMDLADFDLAALLQPSPPICNECADQKGGSASSDFCGQSTTVAQQAALSVENLQPATQNSRSSHSNNLRGSRANDSRLPDQRLQSCHRLADALRSGENWPPSLTIVCAKHLCGGGTDLALRSLEHAIGAHKKECDACLDFATVLAPCCHHLCEWRSYINQAFLGDVFPDAREAFAILVAVAPWATEAQSSNGVFDDDALRRRERRRLLGVKAKRVLDAGRALWLRESLGFRTLDLSLYIDAKVSPENLLLLARR